MPQNNHDDEAMSLVRERCSRTWTVVIDEVPGVEEWVLELESPQIYLTLQVANLSALERAIQLLDSALVVPPPGGKHPFIPKRDDITLGRFGKIAVHLLRDNEDFARCFLVIGQGSRFTLRLSLDEADIRALAEAIRDAMADMPRREEATATTPVT